MKIKQLQGLRFLLFLCIFFLHVGISKFYTFATMAVSLFFILSGMVMVISYYKKDRIKKVSILDNIKFSISKIKKLYVLHIITILLMIPFFIKNIPSLFKGLIILNSNILLLHSWVPKSMFYFSLNGVSWYLSVCLFLYFCLPIILKRLEKNKGNIYIKILILLFIQIVISYLSSLININISDNFVKYFVYICPISRILEFIFGCYLGYIYINKKDKGINNNLLCIFLLIINFIIPIIVLHVSKINENLWWIYTIPYTLIGGLLIYNLARNNSIVSKLLSNKVIVSFGNISSYAFLIHYVVISYVKNLFSSLIYVGIISLIITILLSYGFDLIIKKRR